MENKIGNKIASMRKEHGYTQEYLAEILGVSPQAVSKWENGHSLPETALLVPLARALDISIDALLTDSKIQIISAIYGDGIENHNVTNRLNKLIEHDVLNVDINPISLACKLDNNRPKYIIVKYQINNNVAFTFVKENERLCITLDSAGYTLADKVEIIAATYGTAKASYNAMNKIVHYKVFQWNEYHACHETFPSNPTNDDIEYLTFVYLNQNGINLVTCEEGESIAYNDDKTAFDRKLQTGEHFISNVPMLPMFGCGWECSWAAALTSALQSMGVNTTYEYVMGVSGACYRLVFCSPRWDYSSVDALVVYDYATPGFKAFGYKQEMHGRIEKQDRASHRERIMKEVHNNMPVLGINLRVAPEWGVICGYKNNGEELYCRTKYDKPTIDNDPQFMAGHPEFKKEWLGKYDTLLVDNWPFLLSYFADKFAPPSETDNLINSLKVFIDCGLQECSGTYRIGFNAYEIWINDLLDEKWYNENDDEQFARRFSVNQFCTLSLYDARKSAYIYLNKCKGLLPEKVELVANIVESFKIISDTAEKMHKLLDSGEYLEGVKARAFWTKEMRNEQADMLGNMLHAERKACEIAQKIIK